MKWMMVFLTVLCTQVSATVRSQSITFSGKDVPLETIFSEIEKQTGYVVFCNAELIEHAPRVSVEARNTRLEDFLHQVLRAANLHFEMIRTTIVVMRNEAPAVPAQQPVPSSVDPSSGSLLVRGKVADLNGVSLAGASVRIKGTQRGVSTAADGTFTIEANAGDVLQISYVGLAPIEIQLKADGTAFISGRGPAVDQSQPASSVVRVDGALLIKLAAPTSKLDEAVVIAYGQTTQRYSVGNVSTVSQEQIAKAPVSNPLLALQGRVPGIFINQSTGYANGGMVTVIQGIGSLHQGTDPFFVIDGVPYPSQLLSTTQGAFLGSSGVNRPTAGNPLNYINPKDIESITILKDADATSIYGSRAANGAILITTRKGKGGPLRVDLNIEQGFSKLTNKMNVLNTRQYLEMRHEAINNDGLTVSNDDYDINGFWDTTRSTNWQKELIGKTARYGNYSISLSGGAANVQYLFGGTYHDESTIFPGDFGDKKGAIHFSLNAVSQDQRFRTQITANYSVDANTLSSGSADLLNKAATLAPTAPKIYNDDGSLNWMPNSSGYSTWTNPLSNLQNKYKGQAYNLVSNLALEYKLGKGLLFKTSFGYNRLQANDQLIRSLASAKPEQRSYAERSLSSGINTISSWIIEPQLTYNVKIKDHRLDLLAGSSLQNQNSHGDVLYASGFSSDLLLEDIHSAAKVSSSSSVISAYKYFGVFGRVNYGYDNKYLLNINIRRDGSSRFGPANRYQSFVSVGGGWIFSEEDWLKDALPIVSFGKVRASYGITGNDQIGDYTFLDLYQALSVGVPYRNNISLVPKGVVNPYLRWETNKKANIGLDIGFLKDRILFTVNAYRNRSSNQLANYQLPGFTGVTSVLRNLPATVQNTGFELTLNTTVVATKSFSWTTNLNMSFPRNKLVKYANLETSNDRGTYAVGRSLTSSRLFHSLGVDPATGMYIVADSAGKPTDQPNYESDLNLIVDYSPKFYGGFSHTFTYKQFSLDILFQFVKQQGRSNIIGNYAGYVGFNQPVQVMDRWRKPGDRTSHQQFTSSNFGIFDKQSLAYNSDLVFSDASYIRMKNIAFFYRLSAGGLHSLKIKGGSLFIKAQNLLTITKYVGYDPETGGGFTMPPLKTLVAGIQLSF